MNTADHVNRPHAFAIELLKKELADCSLQISAADTKARQAAARPARDGAERERTRAAAQRWRDLHGRLAESLLVLENAQRAGQQQPAEQPAAGPELNYFAAADAIAGHFIERPQNVELIRSKLLGHGQWDVDANVTYAGSGKTELRPFLLVRTSTGRLLVNP